MTGWQIVVRACATIWLLTGCLLVSREPALGLPTWVRVLGQLGMAVFVAKLIWTAP